MLTVWIHNLVRRLQMGVPAALLSGNGSALQAAAGRSSGGGGLHDEQQLQVVAVSSKKKPRLLHSRPATNNSILPSFKVRTTPDYISNISTHALHFFSIYSTPKRMSCFVLSSLFSSYLCVCVMLGSVCVCVLYWSLIHYCSCVTEHVFICIAC